MIPLRTVGLLVVVLAIVACSSEGRDWRSAQGADTIESYGRFLSKHPEGELAADARARIAQLTEERDWTRTVQLDTASAYERFVAQHPNGRWAQEARIRAETFALTDSVPGTTSAAFHIQLGAFGSERGAREEWERLRGKFHGELHGLSADIRIAETESGDLHRLQARVADEATARELCAALRRESEPCVVVLPRRE
jgi:cell division septation protein DedD